MSVVLRDMRHDDIAAVSAIEATSFSDPWTRGMFDDELCAPGRLYLVAEDEGDGSLVGYAGVMIVGNEAHLMDIAVRNDRRREGIGRLLFESAMRDARGFGAERMTLEVRPGNAAAIALYRAHGLEEVGLRPGYYSDTGEPAVIMWGDLPAEEESDRGCAVCELRREALRTDDLILAIESSCDETAAAVMRGGRELLGDVVASQIVFHARFGGVVPEIASRKHTEAIVSVVEEAMQQAGTALGLEGGRLEFADLDAIAVTQGPGLVGALVVGVAYAKGLAMATGLPLVGVNHLEGHIFANVFADPQVAPPLVALLVSGGHTSLVHMPEWGRYHTLGETLDDAAGEAFDKVAKVLGLGYPGGPILSRMAETGDPAAIDFPRAMMRSGDYAFSLSGLKTAVINHIRHEREAGREIDIPDLAASFQQAVIDVQVSKAVRAVKETGATTFCLAGGVAANPALRSALVSAIGALGVHVSVPPMALCTDNAAMIAAAAHYRFLCGDRLSLDAEPLPNWRLDTE
ncbi:MAG: tRNA (adenosine(37)-N6)-threonylcarbamoyltransferase complex transferase subunit TsaD [Coriobacteriia bacterium]|nr:tRNA (adenosine(37)-N6)-threonylcarbamoyltransferase complex transferase subunit TsaD [Coriobacteriia bacterium]